MSSSRQQSRIVITDEDRLQVMELGALCNVPMALNAALKLNVLEIIAKAGQDGKLSAAEIVAEIPSCKSPSVAASSLGRILRALSSRGILKETCAVDDDGEIMQREYSLTGVSKLLVKNEEGLSLKPWVLFNQDEIFMKTWHSLHHAVLGGEDPFRKAHGKGVFEMAQEDTRLNEMINSTMASHTTFYLKAALEAYKGFQGVKTLVDVGGGCGAALSLIVAAHPDIRGINFDLDHVLSEALEIPGVEHVGGDMFESVPRGDAIFMKWILHDWKDESCIQLLKNCYESLPIGGKVVVMDVVLPVEEADAGSRFAFTMDMLMLAYCVGNERTEEEFRSIAKAAGFTDVAVVVTVDFISILEMHKC